MTSTDQVTTRHRLTSPAAVAQMAAANRAPFTRTAYAASVTLGGATYWWAAA